MFVFLTEHQFCATIRESLQQSRNIITGMLHSVIDADNTKNCQKLYNSPQWMLLFRITDFWDNLERSAITWYWLHVGSYHSESDTHPYENWYFKWAVRVSIPGHFL